MYEVSQGRLVAMGSEMTRTRYSLKSFTNESSKLDQGETEMEKGEGRGYINRRRQ